MIEEEERRAFALDAASRVVAALVTSRAIGPDLTDTAVSYNLLTLASQLELYLDGKIAVHADPRHVEAMLRQYQDSFRPPPL